MTLIEAVKIIDYHQQWRLGKIQEMTYTPKQLAEALDVVLTRVKKDELDPVSQSTKREH